MKRKSFFLTLMLIALMACNGNAKKAAAEGDASAVLVPEAVPAAEDYFKVGDVWHNGVEWYQIRKDGDVFAFVGGTLHEGGSCFGLRDQGNNRFSLVPVKWSLESEDNCEPELSSMNLYGENPKDLTAELKGYGGSVVLVIRHKTKGLLSVLLPAEGNGMEVLDKTLKADMARSFMGNWQTRKGERYVFGAGQSYSFPGEKGNYKFEYEYDTPTCVITMENGTHWTVEMSNGWMLLSEAKKGTDDDDETWGLAGGRKIELTLTAEDLSAWRFPFASTEPLTLGMLSNYGKEDLRVMRNEIWARHGYRFNSPDLQQRFARIQGYSPVSDNSKVSLTPLEQLNVELIKLAESRLDD